MPEEILYEISRYTDSVADEMLINRTQVVRMQDYFVRRTEAGLESRLTGTDVLSAISADSLLSDVYAEHDTRITATAQLAAQLPLVLHARLSDSEAEAAPHHLDADEWRLLVNDARWAPFLTTQDSYALLPADPPEVDLFTTWAAMNFSETDSRTSGDDRASIGLATADVVVTTTLLDPLIDSPEYPVRMWRRGRTQADDAALIAEWFTGNDLSDYLGIDPRMLVRLFAATANEPDTHKICYGDYLALNTPSREETGGTPTSEWRLRLNLSPEVIGLALDTIADTNTEFNDIVTAARDPQSPAAHTWNDLLAENGL